MNKKQRKTLLRIIISLAVLLPAYTIDHILDVPQPVSFAVFFAVYILIGWDILRKAALNIASCQIFDENFLMSIASLGAFAIGEYPEGAAVMLFYQIGELFQSYAVGKSRKSIAALMDIRPEIANIERDGVTVEVDPSDVPVGDTIVVKPGERIPLDGVVIDGKSFVDTSALTGESVPVKLEPGKTALSGSINGEGVLRIRTTKKYKDSTVAVILEMTENAASKKAKAENFITKFAKIYTPCVVLAAAAIAIIPPIILGGGFSGWLRRGLIFLVISCPCALVISVPMSFFGGIGGAGKRGILVKGGCYLEALSKADAVVFDKTGTLTKGVFRVTAVRPQSDSVSESELLSLAALAESYSKHPIARSIKEAWDSKRESHDPNGETRNSNGETHASDAYISDVCEIAGKGVSAVIDGKSVLAGNAALMKETGIKYDECGDHATIVHVARDGEYMGHIVISDEIKDDSTRMLRELRALGIRRTVMLTGDRDEVAEHTKDKLGIDEVRSNLLPQDKVSAIEEFLNDRSGCTLVYVGDGVNDAPVLSRADVGVAMGCEGSDAAVEAADIVLMDDDLMKLPEAVRISKRTMSIVWQNIVFALGIKAAVLILGALGLANMWGAVFADVGVSVIAILNSMRTLKTK